MDLLRQVRRGRLTRVLVPLLAAAAIPATAQAVTFTQTQDVTITTVEESCAGEPVVLSGKMHETIHASTDATSGTHLKLSSNARGLQGELLGAQYVGYSVDETELQLPAFGASVFTVESQVDLVRKGEIPGGMDDLHMKAFFHLVFDQAGGVHVKDVDFEAECT